MATRAPSDPALTQTWDELGLSEADRDVEIDRLHRLLQQVKSGRVESERQKHLPFRVKIEEMRRSHIDIFVHCFILSILCNETYFQVGFW
jgi:hypothetical protein